MSCCCVVTKTVHGGCTCWDSCAWTLPGLAARCVIPLVQELQLSSGCRQKVSRTTDIIVRHVVHARLASSLVKPRSCRGARSHFWHTQLAQLCVGACARPPTPSFVIASLTTQRYAQLGVRYARAGTCAARLRRGGQAGWRWQAPCAGCLLIGRPPRCAQHVLNAQV